MENILKNFSNIKNNITVKDIMSNPVIGVSKDDTIHKAAKIMNENSISTVIVSENNKLIGIVTERDIVKKVILSGKNPKKTKISDIMTPNPVTVFPNVSILMASNLMKRKKVRKLIVVDLEDKIAGIVSQTDIINSMNKIYGAYKSLLWDSRFYFILFLLVTLFFLLNYILFR